MKYTRKRNRRRIVRGGQNSPQSDESRCSQIIKCPLTVAVAFLDKLTDGESRPPSRSATPRGRRPGNSPFPRARSVVTAQPGKKGKGTKSRRKKKKKR